MKSISIGQYVSVDSIVHKLDPRLKIILSFLYIIAVFFAKNFLSYLVFFAFLLFVVSLSKLKIIYIFKSIKSIMFFIIFTAVLNIFLSREGELIFQWFFIKIYSQGIYTALFMSLRLIFLIMGTSILTLTTAPMELADGIESILSPLKKIKVPVHEISMMITIALRFIPTLMDETEKIIKAQKARGVNFESGSLIDRAKNLLPILIPLFINSFRRADDLAIAMESRCYRNGENRSKYKLLKFNYKDFLSIIIYSIFILVAILI